MSPNKYAGLKIGQTIVAYKDDHKDASCEEITAYVKRHFPGCKTNPLSVACTLQKAGRTPGRVAKAQELPQFKPNDHVAEPETEETEDDARKRINVRYEAMERMAPRCIDGRMPSLIISGPPGVGKSWTVTESLKNSARQRHDGSTDVGGGGPRVVEDFTTTGYYDQIQGNCSAVGLFQSLWYMRNGGVCFLDDCDAVFKDDDALNILKVATDSTRERLVSWRKNAAWLDEHEIDKTFDFKGQIIFLTNIDFEAVIARNHPMAEHFKALIDRAAYLCLTLRTARDFMIRIKDVAGGKSGFLTRAPYNFDQRAIAELMGFVQDNQKRFYNLSLRLIGQIAIQMKADPERWRNDVEATKMRTL